MGLYSLPAPSEGVLCILLVNTALSISIVKAIVRSILHVVGIRLSSSSQSPPPSDYPASLVEPIGFCMSSSSDSYVEEFRSMNPAVRFDSVCSCRQPEHECSVCLNQFDPESEINRLSCGHFFHKVCLERWLNYSNITCPMCRTPLMPELEPSCFW